MRNFIRLISLALHSLYSQKLRSFLSIIGIVCGVLAVMVMVATGEGAKKKVLKDLAGLGLGNIYIQQAVVDDEKRSKGPGHSGHGLTWRDVHSLKKQSFIASVAGVKQHSTESLGAGDGVNAKVVYVSSEYMNITGKKVAQGRLLLEKDSRENNLVCVLGADVSKALGAGGRTGEYLRLDGQLYKIVGILDDTGKPSSEIKEIQRDNSNEMVFLSFPIFAMRGGDGPHLSGQSELTEIIVQVVEEEGVIAVSEAIDRQLSLSRQGVRDYSMVVPRELLNQSLKTQAVFNIFLSVTGGISLFVGGIGIMNIMLANVSERRREIGIRRAVGATRRHIILQFLTESVLLTFVGGSAGLLLGLIAVFLTEYFAGWPVQVTFLSVSLPFGLAISAGLFFGLYPAIRAANLEPIEALKSL